MKEGRVAFCWSFIETKLFVLLREPQVSDLKHSKESWWKASAKNSAELNEKPELSFILGYPGGGKLLLPGAHVLNTNFKARPRVRLLTTEHSITDSHVSSIDRICKSETKNVERGIVIVSIQERKKNVKNF